MSTRSCIGYYDGRFHGMYCHYDGDPGHVGMILVEHHNSFEAMQNIITGSQIRNFDSDGVICRFGDGDGAVEVYDSIEEALESGFDYVYQFDGEWKCFTKDRSLPQLVKEVNIPE